MIVDELPETTQTVGDSRRDRVGAHAGAVDEDQAVLDTAMDVPGVPVEDALERVASPPNGQAIVMVRRRGLGLSTQSISA